MLSFVLNRRRVSKQMFKQGDADAVRDNTRASSRHLFLLLKSLTDLKKKKKKDKGARLSLNANISL